MCQIRKTAQSDEILGTPILSIVDAVNGKIGLDFGLSNSQALPTTGLSLDQLDVWVWDAFIFYADGSSECLWEGKFKVSPRVSQHG